MPDISLSLVMIRAGNLERSYRFYSALGLSLVREQHGTGPEHYACVIGTTTFEIYPHRGELHHAALPRLGFRVPSLDTTLSALQETGAEIVTPPSNSSWGRRAVVSDPDGHRIELVE
jgi:catechol 2,3-dioxygenase-like lactoylglutathione lyase family enzyme